MNGHSVRMTLQWTLASGQARPIAEALQMLTFNARAQRGCLGCSFATEPGDSVVVLRYVEDWATEEDLQRQVKSVRFAKLAELIELGEAHAHVEFEGLGSVRGLEYAEELRCRK